MRSRVIWRKNQNYNPWEDRIDFWISCEVCGYPLDDERTQEVDRFGAMTQVTTGTVYAPEVGSGVEGFAQKDKQTVTNISAYRGCPFCGSGNFRAARGPEGLIL